MKRVADHLSDVLSIVRPLTPLTFQLLDAHGCVLAEDVVAPWPLPQFDNSAMDGYAVRAEDVRAATEDAPVELPVVTDIAAGETERAAIGPGLAARIMTGAPDARRCRRSRSRGANRRRYCAGADHAGRAGRTASAPVGEDVQAGDTVLAAGTFLGAAQIGLLAAVGKERVRVRPRPRVVVISTDGSSSSPASRWTSGRSPTRTRSC